MSEKYTFEDWKNYKQVTPSEEGKRLNDFYRGLAKAGRIETEELLKIRDKQRWIYENAVQINSKASIESFKAELLRTDYPESYLEKEINEVNSELAEKPHIKDRVLEGGDDYYNMTGLDLKEVEEVLEGKNSNKFYQIFSLTYEKGKWVPNNYLRIASLLHYQNFLNSFDLKTFIRKTKKSTNEVTPNKQGAPIKGLSNEEALKLFDKFQSEKPSSFVYKEDGSYNRYQFQKYLAEYVSKHRIDISESTIERRAQKAIDTKMGS